MLNEHREMNAGLTDGACSESGLVPDELEAAIRVHVRRVYDKYGQNLSKAAEALKVARNTAKKYLDFTRFLRGGFHETPDFIG